MKKRRLRDRPAVIKTIAIAAASAIGLVIFSAVTAAEDPGWLSPAVPGLSKSSDLSANQTPPPSNRDCDDISYTKPDGTAASDCFVASGTGLLGSYGNPFIVSAGSPGIPVLTTASNSYLLPVPHQDTVLVQSPEPAAGVYLHLYRDGLVPNLQPRYDRQLPPRKVIGYDLTKPPDVDIKDKNGRLMAFNAFGTLAFSSDGRWLVADAIGVGFVRINLTTLQVTPFAPTLNPPGDYAAHSAVTAISDDGRYAVVGSYQRQSLTVFDLSQCGGSTTASYSQLLDCRQRDYWPELGGRLHSFRNVYAARFVNDDNLSLTLTYDWQSSSVFRAAVFRLTAPGKAARALDYLALGDSFVSGQGEFNYKSGTDTAINGCHLSPLAYPFTVGSASFDSYNSIACSGATINDITNTSGTYQGQVTDHVAQQDRDASSIERDFSPGYLAQLMFIKQYQPQVVTLAVGGNDIGFSKLLQACAVPYLGLSSPATTCFETYDERMRIVRTVDAAYGKLRSVYQQIAAADPGVRLYVVGYPQLVTDGNCAANVWLNGDEINFSKQLVSYLNFAVKRAADTTGAYYVDAEDAFGGHRLCETRSNDVAVNGLTRGDDGGPWGLKVFGAESYHPNVLGHELLAARIKQLTSGLTAAMPVPDPNLSPPSPNDTLAQLLLNNYIYSGNQPAEIVSNDDSIAPDAIAKNNPPDIAVDGRANGLKPNATYQISLQTGSTTVKLGEVSSDSQAGITFRPTVSAAVSPGTQTVHITGENLAGKTIDIYKVIYIVAEADDLDGNGVPNSQEACPGLPPSGHDVDSDGVDDACDPQIRLPPEPTYPATVTLTNNSVTASRP